MERPQLWSPETIIVPEKKQRFYGLLAQKEGGATYANVKATWVQVMKAELPDGAFETKDDMYHRSQHGLTVIRDFVNNNPLQGDEKLAIVCHSQFIAGCTADGFSGEGNSAQLTNFIWT